MKKNKLGLVVSFWAALIASGCSKEASPPPKPPPVKADASWPNLVLISVDTLRPDHLGCYGYPKKTSPRIDRLAAEGALFENAISSTSWTLPAHCALFTGLCDSVHGCQEMNQRLPDNRETLAERLRASGYATAGFFAGPALHPVFGVAQGFDSYHDCTSFTDLTNKIVQAGQSLDGGAVQAAATADVTNPRVYREVDAWLRQNQRRPFFLFIHLWDVHFDFLPPPPYDRMFDPDYRGTVTGQGFFIDPAVNPNMPARDLEHVIALYDGEIAWTDEHIGKILDVLDALRLRESTLVILTADHGEEFFEHGRKGHRQTLYDEVLRIPLIVRAPGRVAAGQRIREQARIIDLLPTAMELAGAPAPTDVMGRSLAPRLRGTAGPAAEPSDDVAVSELYSVGHELRSFRRLDAKLIRNEKTKGVLYFDLHTDPGERSPAANAAGAAVQALLAQERRILALLDEFRRLWPGDAGTPQLPDHVRRQLEGLGYIGGNDE